MSECRNTTELFQPAILDCHKNSQTSYFDLNAMLRSLILFLSVSAFHGFQPSFQSYKTSRLISSSAMSYANTIEIPETYGSGNSFETRMKALVLGDEKLKKSASTSKSCLPNVFEAVTLQDFKRLVGDERERISVVRFHAPWCRACLRTAPLFDRLAVKYPNVNFVKVQVGPESQHLVAAFGIPKFPYGQIYHPTQGLAEELSMNKNVFQDFCRILASYVDESCELPGINEETGIVEAPYQRVS